MQVFTIFNISSELCGFHYCPQWVYFTPEDTLQKKENIKKKKKKKKGRLVAKYMQLEKFYNFLI